MGIYANGNIFGIRIYNVNEDDFSNTLFEEKYNERMSHTQMREAYLFYTLLNDKTDVCFQWLVVFCVAQGQRKILLDIYVRHMGNFPYDWTSNIYGM